MKNLFQRSFFTLPIVLILILLLAYPVFAQSSPPPPLSSPPVSADMIAAVAGIILSLLFSYIPGFNTKFAGLDPAYKRLVMLLLLLITAAGIYGLGCGGILQTGLACGQEGITQIVWYFILAAIANQTSYQLSPQTKSVITAKAGPKQ